MNRLMRPYIQAGVALVGAAILLAPSMASAQATRITQIIEEPSRLLVHSSAQGYLGVLVGDVDADSASKLKLKEVRGAVVTLIDHDAPAAQVGLRVNDVLLELNDQPVESAEAFGRMMREIPAGRKVTMLISRDGVTQTLTVQLADRKKLDTAIWNKLNDGSDISRPVDGLGILGNGGGDAPLPGGFHMPFVGNSTLKVGALVEPLTAQMADYLGIQNGLMVKQVARKSEAAAAGMKAFDVILKVGAESIATVSDWERSMRTNQGKAVQVTVLRDKKQTTLTLQVDSKKKSDVEFPGFLPFHQFLPDGPCPLIAFAGPDVVMELQKQLLLDESAMLSMGEESEALQDQLNEWQDQNFGGDAKQMEELQKQMEQFNKQFFGADTFKFDQKQMDQFKQDMDKFRQDFKPQEFKFDLDTLPNALRKPEPQSRNFEDMMRDQQKQERDQLKRQMEETQALGFDHLA